MRFPPTRLAVVFWLAVRVATAAPGTDANAETGRFLGRDYTFRDYKAHHQNWTIAPDAAGIVHIGNKGCVLEFDGQEWRLIPVPGTTFVRGLALGPDGRMYVGAVDELGYIEVTPYGGKRFVSLRDRLPVEEREFGDIWHTVANAQGVFFATDFKVLRWQDGRFHRWNLPEGRTTLHQARGQVFLHQRGQGLFRIEGDALVPFCTEAALRERRVAALLADPLSADLIACTNDAGLFRIAPDGSARAFVTDADAWLKREMIQTALVVSGQRLLIGSRQGGLMLLDAAGRFLRRIDEAEGVRDPLVRALASSGSQLWWASNSNLTVIDASADATLFAREQGLDGSSVRAVTRHGGVLHVATGQGVFRLVPRDRTSLTNARLEPVAGFNGRYFSLLSTAHGLLAGANDEVHALAEGTPAATVVVAGPRGAVALAHSTTRSDRVWVGSVGGVSALDWREGGWHMADLGPEFRFEARTIVELDDGTLWFGTFTRGIGRAKPAAPGDQRARSVEFFLGTQGLPPGQRSYHLVRAGTHLMALAANGSAFRFNPALDRFEPVDLESASDGPPAEPPVAWLPSSRSDQEGSTLYAFDARGGATLVALPRLAYAAGPLQGVFGERRADGTPVVWLAGADGLGRAALPFLAPESAAPTAPSTADTPPAGVMLRTALLNGQVRWPAGQALPAGAHQIAFRFSASTYAPDAEFSTRLDGFEPGWSDWSRERVREFSNLPPGDYVFKVRARYGRVPAGAEHALLSFSIAAPWWSAWWARATGLLMLLGAVAGLVHWRVRAYRRRNERLEQVVAARTAELRANQEQLRSARDAAEAANRAKSAFLAHMSHELRTPLNGILGYAQVMSRDATVDAANRERLRVISTSGQHLLRLINEVLDLSKIEAGKITLNPAPCDLPRLLATVGEIFHPRAAELGLAFRTELADDLPANVVVDEAKLTQVLVNLLGNAFKFTRAGCVTLVVTRTQPHAAPATDGSVRITFAVEDTGIGIAPGDLERIFRPFEQVGGGDATAPGSGLGLAISQRIVAALGGELRVTSQLESGSRFWFELTLGPARATAAASLPSATGRITGYRGTRRRVVIIDDNAVNRDVLRHLLEPLGFDVRCAGTGALGLAACAELDPHLVLLDLRMAPMDGFAVARELRVRTGGAALKIVAVSASAFDFDRNDALRAGCDGFLPKPFTEEALLEEIGRQLGVDWMHDQAAPPATRPRPREEIILELLRLVTDGKVPRLRRRLAALRAEDSPHAPFYDHIDGLAAEFKLQRLQEELAGDPR